MTAISISSNFIQEEKTMASIKVSNLRLKNENLRSTTFGLPVDSENYMTELREELGEEQLEAVVGGMIDSGGSGGSGGSYHIECYRIGNALGGVHTVCRRIYTSSGPV